MPRARSTIAFKLSVCFK